MCTAIWAAVRCSSPAGDCAETSGNSISDDACRILPGFGLVERQVRGIERESCSQADQAHPLVGVWITLAASIAKANGARRRRTPHWGAQARVSSHWRSRQRRLKEEPHFRNAAGVTKGKSISVFDARSGVIATAGAPHAHDLQISASATGCLTSQNHVTTAAIFTIAEFSAASILGSSEPAMRHASNALSEIPPALPSAVNAERQ